MEAKDCSPEEYLVEEVNLGVYAVDSAFLPAAVADLKDTNNQKELYLTDIVLRASKEGQTVLPIAVPESEGLGVNDPYDLCLVANELNKRKVKSLALAGVFFRAMIPFIRSLSSDAPSARAVAMA